MQKIIERKQQAVRIYKIGFDRLSDMLHHWSIRKFTPDELDRKDGKKS